jgi:hypothetical protein
LYLGISQFGVNDFLKRSIYKETKYENIVQVFNMLATHAILYLNQDFVNFIIKSLNISIQYRTDIDILIAKSHIYHNVYAMKDPFFIQTSGNYIQNTSSFEVENIANEKRIKEMIKQL